MVKYYAVKSGKEGPKIYTDWETCKQQVLGFPGAVYKSFSLLEDAQNFINSSNSLINQPVLPVVNSNPFTYKVITQEFPLNSLPVISGDQSFLERIYQLNPIQIYTDGSASPVTQKAGSGIYFPQLNIGLSVNVPGNQTNNRGEIWAVIYGLEYIQAHLRAANLPPIPTIIYSDSMIAINILIQNNQKNLDLVALIKLQKQYYPFEFVKVLAHSGDVGNERADQLAKISAGL